MTKQNVVYGPSYFSIAYSYGDVPSDKGVWRDVNIRDYRKSGDGKEPIITHNIRKGQVFEDCLFSFEILGHYRY